MTYIVYVLAGVGALVIVSLVAYIAWYFISLPFKIHHDAFHQDRYYRPRKPRQ